MTNQRTFINYELLKQALPKICLGLDDDGNVISNESEKVNPNVILRSIVQGVFPREITVDYLNASYVASCVNPQVDYVENFCEKDITVIIKKTKRENEEEDEEEDEEDDEEIKIDKIFQCRKDIEIFWQHCVPVLIENPDVQINIININYGENKENKNEMYKKPAVFKGKLMNGDFLIKKYEDEWNDEIPWNVSLLHKFSREFGRISKDTYVLFGSKILEDRNFNDTGDFLYYYYDSKRRGFKIVPVIETVIKK
eukprot:GHVR01068590.1.p1 GENE.GHVR01068590.1~~GHVR01068590.1.p1  ORF type:complete len:254 (+),score=39.67 GHVR01068590.1:325-1086(+)